MTDKVTLSPLTPELTGALRDVRVTDDQVMFSGQPFEVIDNPEPDLDIHVILLNGQVVGMFRIDNGYHRAYAFARPDTPGLRTFLIDQQMQGRGIATACCKQLQSYLSDHYPHATAVFLTVNLQNPRARKVYLAGGFGDTGKEWPYGDAGPQNILRLNLGG
ncbi:GNAT family N-acetyltransferase [Yoonia sp. GPGPB17]|uniref:GNAT family N-acetyltransferase n=1 Tax=Yoonia sp. GPGPB17 TaxID=3026147 RepID=UPI0030C36418